MKRSRCIQCVVVNLVAHEGDIVNRSRRLIAVERYRERIGAVTTAEGLNDVMDVIVQNLKVIPGTFEIDANRNLAPARA